MALFVFVITFNSYSQNIKSFFKLSCPEKQWVLCHIFIAKKSYNIGLEASEKAKELSKDSTLDGDLNGGQLDAFRHAYWMARITQNFGWRSAATLGKAHEKGNYREYKKHRTEDGTFPDAQSGQMDYLNNDAGIELGKCNKDTSPQELTNKVKELLFTGKLFILKKDKVGNYLKCNGDKITSEELKGKWETPKCILPSNNRKTTN